MSEWRDKVKLAELIEVQNGFAFSSKDYSTTGHFLMRIGNVQDGYICMAHPKFVKLPADGSLRRFELSENDILASLTGNIGRVGVINAEHLPAALNQRVAKINICDHSHIDKDYVLLFLRSHLFREALAGAGHGTAQQNVSTKDLVEIKIPVPSLDEQQRIVALLDEAFEVLATAIANAEQSLQNARALLESHLESVFTKQGPESEEHALGELIEIQNGFAFKSGEYTDSGYFVIRISNVQDGFITLGNPRFVKLTDKRLERFILNEGDILVSLTGNIGRVGVVQEDHLPAVLNQRVARITIRHHSIDRDFLFRFLMSRFFREKLQAAGHGAAQQNVSTQEIETVRLFLPSKEEQQRIAKEFDGFVAEIQRLTSIYERKLAALEELKASLLHQAFNGEL